ncbi:acyltransferase, partial [Francisella tularensis subsp. holarctica]|nr:acyltransferase [Francisella tularensis subsp. holarctica]
HLAVKSNYKNLINPKAVVIAVILKFLSDRMVGILNTTIIYDIPEQNLWDFMVRKTKKLKLKVELIPISEVAVGDYFIE